MSSDEPGVKTSLRVSASIAGRDVGLTASYDSGGAAAFEGTLVFDHEDLKSLVGQLFPSLAQVLPPFDSERSLSFIVSLGGACKSVGVGVAKLESRNGSKVRGADEISAVVVRGERDLTIAALTNKAPIGAP